MGAVHLTKVSAVSIASAQGNGPEGAEPAEPLLPLLDAASPPPVGRGIGPAPPLDAASPSLVGNTVTPTIEPSPDPQPSLLVGTHSASSVHVQYPASVHPLHSASVS